MSINLTNKEEELQGYLRLSDDDFFEAKHNLLGYFDTLFRIHERLANEGKWKGGLYD